jgi:hypothetical protein
MTSPLSLHTFRHRENLDGTWDSICMRCYATAAHSHEHAALGHAELRHHCDETTWMFKEAAGAPTLRTAHKFTHRSLSVMRGGRPAGLREQSQSHADS